MGANATISLLMWSPVEDLPLMATPYSLGGVVHCSLALVAVLLRMDSMSSPKMLLSTNLLSLVQ